MKGLDHCMDRMVEVEPRKYSPGGEDVVSY